MSGKARRDKAGEGASRGKRRVAAEGRRPIRRAEPDGETRGAELGGERKTVRKKENSHQEKGGREGKVRVGEGRADLEGYETIFF